MAKVARWIYVCKGCSQGGRKAPYGPLVHRCEYCGERADRLEEVEDGK